MRAYAFVAHTVRYTRLFFSIEKKLSAMLVSQHTPVFPIKERIPNRNLRATADSRAARWTLKLGRGRNVSGDDGSGVKVRWAKDPQLHDYPAAVSYLTLMGSRVDAERLVDALDRTPIVFHPAKDLLRASRLGLLPVDDPYVAKDLKRIRKGKELSPVLLLRGNLLGVPLEILDGYHRVCASYHLSEDTPVSAQIISLDDAPTV